MIQAPKHLRHVFRRQTDVAVHLVKRSVIAGLLRVTYAGITFHASAIVSASGSTGSGHKYAVLKDERRAVLTAA